MFIAITCVDDGNNCNTPRNPRSSTVVYSGRTRLDETWMNYLNHGEKTVGVKKIPPRDERLQSQSCRTNTECIQALFPAALQKLQQGNLPTPHPFTFVVLCVSVRCVNVLAECRKMSHCEVTGEIHDVRQLQAFCFITSAKKKTISNNNSCGMIGPMTQEDLF